jgi:GxxExxY protein
LKGQIRNPAPLAGRDPPTERVIGAAIDVHRELGPGLLESAYEECLAMELADAGLQIQRQVELPLRYKGRDLDAGYRLDLVVGERPIVELKCVERLLPIHDAQLLTYLRLSGIKTGLLLNFNTPVMFRGVKRLVL